MDITLVYFVYGLAFFSMGLALLFESGRSSMLAGAAVLLPLAIFGFVHGMHEWLEMFIDNQQWAVFRDPWLVAWLRIGILSVSFFLLFVFGLRMWNPERRLTLREIRLWVVGLVLYIFVAYLIGFSPWVSHIDRLKHLDATVRYLIAVPGAILAGVALFRRAKSMQIQGYSDMAAGLRGAAWGFLVYALTQIVVLPLDTFPANSLNTATFIAITGVPVQMVRAVMAVVITVSLIVVIRAAEKERQRQFLAAQQARLDALQQVEKELIEREALRQNLMRHIVLAQEEERARIARELHDEVSQLLTAFSFHLAALRRAEINNTKAREQVDYLQGLSRQVSQGIYRLVHDLRPAQLDDLGLSAALLYLVDEQQRHTGLKTHVQISGERRRLDPLVETVFFRVAQEALANVARHARVQEAEMSLEFTPTQVALRVIDRGVGFDPQAPRSPDWGWGLAGMRERSDSIDGQLLIQSAPGQGTRIEIIVQHVPLLESMEQKTQLNNLTEVS